MHDQNASIAERLQALYQRIEAARPADGPPVQLLAVSKKQPLEKIRAAAEAGQRAFGENYAQEGIDKIRRLADPRLEWHHIGPIQSNKCGDIARHFHWAQGVDRDKIIRRLGAARPTALPPLNICVQINISGEASKSGAAADAAASLCQAVQAQPGLRLRGLMAIPAAASEADPRPAFEQLHRLYQALRRQGLPLDTLSMGMSDDFEAAIAAGSSMVRIGSALFGPRAQD